MAPGSRSTCRTERRLLPTTLGLVIRPQKIADRHYGNPGLTRWSVQVYDEDPGKDDLIGKALVSIAAVRMVPG